MVRRIFHFLADFVGLERMAVVGLHNSVLNHQAIVDVIKLGSELVLAFGASMFAGHLEAVEPTH